MRERRSFVRSNGLVLVNYKIPDLKMEGKSSAFDISAAGLRITASKKISLGLSVEMEIYLPGNSQAILAKGQVVWAHKHKQKAHTQVSPETKYFYAGIKFTVIDENNKKRIISYVHRKSLQLKQKKKPI